MSTKSALKSGLDPESQFVLGESREKFAQLQTEWYDNHAPANTEERLQVDNLIRNEWFLRRYFLVEAQLWEYHSTLAERGTGVELGEAFTKASPIFMRLPRCLAPPAEPSQPSNPNPRLRPVARAGGLSRRPHNPNP